MDWIRNCLRQILPQPRLVIPADRFARFFAPEFLNTDRTTEQRIRRILEWVNAELADPARQYVPVQSPL